MQLFALTFLPVCLLLMIMGDAGQAFPYDRCMSGEADCLRRYDHYKIFYRLVPPWKTKDLNVGQVCWELYKTHECLHHLVYEQNCPYYPMTVSRLAVFEAQNHFLCAGYNTPFFTTHASTALVRSPCVTNASISFQMRIGAEACKDMFREGLQRGDNKLADFCLLNQEMDACVVNALRVHCADPLFINYFRSVWFAKTVDPTNGTHPKGPCYPRTSQLYDLHLSL